MSSMRMKKGKKYLIAIFVFLLIIGMVNPVEKPGHNDESDDLSSSSQTQVQNEPDEQSTTEDVDAQEAGAENQSDESVSHGDEDTAVPDKEDSPEEDANSQDESGVGDDRAEPEMEEVFFHRNKTINTFFNEYNQIAEYKITPEMVTESRGASSDNNAMWYSPDMNIEGFFRSGHSKGFLSEAEETYADLKSYTADFDIVFCYFRDICRTLNPQLTDERIEEGWEELLTGQYRDIVTTYDLDGIQINTNQYDPDIKTTYFCMQFSTFLYPPGLVE